MSFGLDHNHKQHSVTALDVAPAVDTVVIELAQIALIARMPYRMYRAQHEKHKLRVRQWQLMNIILPSEHSHSSKDLHTQSIGVFGAATFADEIEQTSSKSNKTADSNVNLFEDLFSSVSNSLKHMQSMPNLGGWNDFVSTSADSP
eukprot:gene25630-32106_t